MEQGLGWVVVRVELGFGLCVLLLLLFVVLLLLLFVVVCCPFLGCFVYLGLLVGIRYARGFLLKRRAASPWVLFCT